MTDQPRRRLLVTGASGLLGAALLDRFSPHWNITALVGRHRVTLTGVENVSADLSAPSTIASLVEHARPDVVVHAAAWTDLDACEANPTLARTIHRDASRAIAEAAAKVGALLVYISTDSLFSRVPGPHREDDLIAPQSVYAKTKREGEEACLEACTRSLILRTCIVGWNAQPKVSLAEWLLRELRGGRTAKAFTDVWFTPILTTTFAAAVDELIQHEARGILHVAGRECTSKYDFAIKLADVFGVSRALIVPSSVSDVQLKAPRPRAPCLDSSKFARLTGQHLQTVDEALRELHHLEEVGWRDRIRAAISL